jgi:hypothetical protein
MDNIIMSKKERDQLRVFGQIKASTMTRRQAARELGMEEHQVGRKYQRWLLHGDQGLAHRTRGVPSKRKWAQEAKAIQLLSQTCYAGFGPTLASEKLAELHQIKVSIETLRSAMLRVGLWNKRRKRSGHRRWREPKEHYGMLLQMDGSDHLWFEDRGPRSMLYNAVDDATSEVPALRFVQAESTKDIMQFMKDYIEHYGRPEAVYIDCHGTWRVNLNNPDGDRLTQLERAMQELNIRVIHAKSPQAKGRVERKNGVLQDRLVKELRLANISTVAEANKFIQDIFLPEFNKKFSRRTDRTKDIHRLVDGFDLDRIFSIQQERVVQNDFTVLYERRVLQIERENYAIVRPKNKIMVHENLNGSLELFLRGIKLQFREVAFRERRKLTPVEHVNQANETRESGDETRQQDADSLFFSGKMDTPQLLGGVYAPRLEPPSLM